MLKPISKYNENVCLILGVGIRWGKEGGGGGVGIRWGKEGGEGVWV